MQTIEAFDVRTWDGGDRHNHSFYLTDKDEAEKYRKTHTCDTVTPVTFLFFATLEEAAENSRAELRKRALGKLTSAEREALGFPRD